MDKTRICKNCGRVFTPRVWNALTCSGKCSTELRRLNSKKYMNDNYHNNPEFKEKVKQAVAIYQKRVGHNKHSKEYQRAYRYRKALERYTPEQISMFIEIAERQQIIPEYIKESEPCYICGSTENVVEHHVSYIPEEKIDFCTRCHSILHIIFLKQKKVRPKDF